MITTTEIRSAFLDFFSQYNGHKQLPSSPLIPNNDPTLLFTNAGMVQFKDIFLGKSPVTFPRVVTSQKCLRAGGKHNDLENVGYTSRHHTFFEMLGNFSFGDYFKEEAIDFAWCFIKNILKLDSNKIIITVNRQDQEAITLWRKIAGLSDDRIISGPDSDNFWSMGDVGPCGPCSEIFYDHGDSYKGTLTSDDYNPDERFVEIWNLVFMQYNRGADGVDIPLAKQSVDTGMGLERIAAACQGVNDNYYNDIFRQIIDSIHCHTGATLVSPADKIVADHVRAALFLLSDGVLPGSTGRDYALRKIIRRGVRYAKKLDDFRLSWLVEPVADIMGSAYPEIMSAVEVTRAALDSEQDRFSELLASCMQYLDKTSRECGKNLPKDLPFIMYDTYGLPFDITQEILREEYNIVVDQKDFDHFMTEQQQRSQGSWKGQGEEYNMLDFRSDSTKFVGYDTLTEGDCKIIHIIVNNRASNILGAGASGIVVLDKTPFYAESGGQVSDTGMIYAGSSLEPVAHVSDCQKSGNVFLHYVHNISTSKSMTVNDLVTAAAESRLGQACNHSATHLLHYALRKILGKHVAQKGSLVDKDRLRFDFSHSKPLSDDEIRAIEEYINKIIIERWVVNTQEMNINEAKKLGAIALFGEKYGESARVVCMKPEQCSRTDAEYEVEEQCSIELCGGTHVRNTGDIVYFKITSSAAIGAGIRRIEAVTNREALQIMRRNEMELLHIAHALNVRPENVCVAVTELKQEKKVMEKLYEYVQCSQICTLHFNAESDIARLIDKVVDRTVPLKNYNYQLIRVGTPRYTDYIEKLARQSGRVIISIEFISSEFAKIRVCGIGKTTDEIASLIQGIKTDYLIPKGRTNNRGKVFEQGYKSCSTQDKILDHIATVINNLDKGHET